MTDQNPHAEPSSQPPRSTPMQIGIGAQYIKDLSFENPAAPQIFSGPAQAPELDFGVNVQTRNLGNNAFEVVLMLKLQARAGGKTAFIGELAYGGVFMVPPMQEPQLKTFLLVEAPHMLFPFARAVLTNVVRDGGFPGVLINPVDFMAMYLASQQGTGPALSEVTAAGNA